MSSWMAWLGFTPEQIDVLGRVLGIHDSSARLVPSEGVPPAGAGAPLPAVALRYGIFPPSQKPANINMMYGVAPPASPGSVRIILTDKQKADLQSQGVKPCDYFDVVPTPVMKYGITPMITGQPAAISPLYGIILSVK